MMSFMTEVGKMSLIFLIIIRFGFIF